MPNWCTNKLTIEGDEEGLDNLFAFVSSERSEFDFFKIVPYPDRFRQMDEEIPEWNDPDRYSLMKEYVKKWGTDRDGFNSGGYDWCVTNWGTKWGASEVSSETGDGYIVYYFDTAWCPPLALLDSLVALYPSLHFHLNYEEPGMAFGGDVIWSNGVQESHISYDLEPDEEYMDEDDEE